MEARLVKRTGRKLTLGHPLTSATVLFAALTFLTPRACPQRTSATGVAPGLDPQDPTVTPDRTGPIVITEGQTISTTTGAQTQVLSSILQRPNDAEHAVDPQTGRNFNWDPEKKVWVNSRTGEAANFTGYLCPTPPTGATGSLQPQDPTAVPDRIGPIVITEGQTVSTATGAQTQVVSSILQRPNDAEHAVDPQTGRNFNWDPEKKVWVNSRTGEVANFTGYLCPTPSAPLGTAPEPAPPHPATPTTTATPPAPSSSSQTSMSTTGSGIQFQLRGIGGVSFINGNTPATAGFDGAVLFPLGSRISIGPAQPLSTPAPDSRTETSAEGSRFPTWCPPAG